MKLYDQIKVLLEKKPSLRDDYHKLIWSVWYMQGITTKGYITLDEFIKLAAKTETIRRTAQKVVQDHPELKPSQQVQEWRDEKEAQRGTFVYRENVEVKPYVSWEESAKIFEKYKEEMKKKISFRKLL